MPPTLAPHPDQLAALCREFGVTRLDLFGSATQARFDPVHSDIDVAAEFDAGVAPDPLAQYFGFKAALESLFGRPVDVVVANAVKNPYLRASIEQTRQPLYAA